MSVHNLTVSYQRHPAIHHLNGCFMRATATAVFGPNGAGKSTLLKAIIGMLKADTGHIALNRVKRSDIAYLPQQAEIDRSLPLSVRDLVSTGLWWRTGVGGRVGQEGEACIMAALKMVGLADLATRPMAALSTGQFQRVLFARIVVQDAQLILLDEPFSAIDMHTSRDLLACIARWGAEQRTIIAVLHDPSQLATFFPQTLLLARQAIAWGKTEDVLVAANLNMAYELAKSWASHSSVCSRAL